MSCWERLGIEPTDDQNAIRNAYRARLPSVHPERDPDGFQALRGAYEEALDQARGEAPAEQPQAAPLSAGEQAAQQFNDLLIDTTRRFQPQAWQDYCRVLDQLPLDVLDSIDGSLRHLLLSNGPLSHTCAAILAERMGWANRLMQLPFEEAEALDQLLQRIAEPDPFDLTHLSTWPLVAQVETLWYVRTLNHLFHYRPLQEMRGWCSLHLCLPMPTDPAYYPGLYRQCTLAGIALGDALEHYQTCLAQTPDDLDTLYMLALQMQNHGQDAVDIWCRLWREYQLPEASAWLLAWSAHHAPERLPLLILAFDRSQSDLGLQRALDDPELINGEPAIGPQTLSRWQRAASTELPPLARAFVAWQLGDSEWPVLAELLNIQDEALHGLYRHAWLLQRGDVADLDALLALPIAGDPLHVVLLEGLQHQARQQRQWLCQAPAWQALQQALAGGEQLPAALLDNTVARSQMLRGFRRLRHYDDTTLQGLRRLLAPIENWHKPSCFELQLTLQQAGRSLPAEPDEPAARWRWQCQTLLLLGLMEQPEDWLARLGDNLATLPTDPGHPAHEMKAQLLVSTPRRWLLELDEQDTLHGLIAALQVSPEILLHTTRLPSATRLEACVQQYGHELTADPFGQMLLDAMLYHDPSLTREQRDEALQRLQGFTCPGDWFEPFRQGLISGKPQYLAQSVCKDNSLEFAIMQAIFDGLRQLCGKKPARLPDTDVLRKLQKAKDSTATPLAIRLAVSLLLARYEQLLPAPGLTSGRASQWQFWRLGGRLNRLNLILQTLCLAGVALPLIVAADELSGDLALGVLGVAVLVLIGNLLRRLHDMGRGIGTLLMLLSGSFLLPYMLLVLFVWPGDPLTNRYGPASSKAPTDAHGLQAKLRHLNGVKQ